MLNIFPLLNIPDTSNLVTNTAFNTKIVEVEKKP